MKHHRATLAEGRLIYQPYLQNAKGDLIALVVGALLVLFGVGYASWKGAWVNEASFILIGLGAVAILSSLFKSLFQTRVRLIFDARTGYVYKKQPWGMTWKVIPFGEVHSIFVTSEYGNIYYSLSRQRNRFGKGVRISNSFNPNKTKPGRREFEEQILPAIERLTGIGPQASDERFDVQ